MFHRLRGQASIRLRRPIDRCFAHVQLRIKNDMPPKKKDKGKERARDDDIVEVDKEEQSNNETLTFNGSFSPSSGGRMIDNLTCCLQRPCSS